MKKKKRNNLWDKLRLLNPKNLANEVHVYGYNFSWKMHVFSIICSLTGISAIGVLFHLQPLYFSLIEVSVLLIIPVLILYMHKRMYEQQRFADAVTYCEQILYSFQKNNKVISALKETRDTFEDGHMREVIDAALAYLEAGNVNTRRGLLREALGIIEESYACVKLHMVHELLISSEEYGGNTEKSILLILNDIELWKRRGYHLMAEKKKSHIDNMISIVVATILCAVALYTLQSMGKLFPTASEPIDIFGTGIIQLSSFVFIVFMLRVLTKSFKSLTANWLRSETLRDEKYILSNYNMVMEYDDAIARRKSIIWAAPFFIAAIVAFLFGTIIPGVICTLIAAFMLVQHRIGYNLAKKDVHEEMYIALPQWLMEIALLLQTNNVQVSIAKSIEEAPLVLKAELEKLVERLRAEPDKLSSYTSFCREFDLPEVQSCMKMLHAISESGTGNAEVQINNLIQRVNEMQNMADALRDKNAAFLAKMLFSYPVMAATVKLLIDLSIGMVSMLQMLGGMSGT